MSKPLVLQSDFGIVDGAVSAMTGVALCVDESLRIYDLSHSVTPFNIFEASYRLFQSLSYWPVGSVFVSVVDPGVGSSRSSVVALTHSGHIIISPNNGSLSHIQRYIGLQSVFTIDVAKNRRVGALNQSYTFDGRDLYAYVGARIASGQLQVEDVGEACDPKDVSTLDLPGSVRDGDTLSGAIEIFDERYGSIWSSVLYEDFEPLNPILGDRYRVVIHHQGKVHFDQAVVFGKSFAAVGLHEPILYVSSLNRLALGLNQGSFKETFQVDCGLDWSFVLHKD